MPWKFSPEEPVNSPDGPIPCVKLETLLMPNLEVLKGPDGALSLPSSALRKEGRKGW